MIHIKCKGTNLEPIAVKIGIIGGSGLDDPDLLENRKETQVSTPYGDPSDVLIEGEIGGVKCVLLARHGRKHDIMPTNVNYRANIFAMRHVGCTHLIVSTACGSLREEIQPGNLVVPHDFIDRTTKRAQTFYDGGPQSPAGVCHLPMYPSFHERTRGVLLKTAKELDYEVHEKATIVTIEGPRFSSRSESNMFRQWGGDLVNMTSCPEVVLAKEAGLLYGSVAIATDYDCWRMGCEGVSVQEVLKTFAENVIKVKKILVHAVANIAKEDWTEEILDAKCTAITTETILSKRPVVSKCERIDYPDPKLQPLLHSISIAYELAPASHYKHFTASESDSQTDREHQMRRYRFQCQRFFSGKPTCGGRRPIK